MILVGNSWAGKVITEAGVDPKVVGLVYFAAFAPDSNETVAALGHNCPAPPTVVRSRNEPRADAFEPKEVAAAKRRRKLRIERRTV